MIVVVGSPRALREPDAGSVAAVGLASEVALVAVRDGARVQLIGRVGEDAAGEAVLLDLAQRGVGHVAVLRDAGRPTPEIAGDAFDEVADEAVDSVDDRSELVPTLDAADLELALSYLPEYGVIVVAEQLPAAALRVVADAARWAGAALVVVGPPDEVAGLPEDATAFAPPAGDDTGAFAEMVGMYAAGLDRGEDPRSAFDAATAAVGSSATD